MSGRRSGGARSEGSAQSRSGRGSKAVSYAEDSDSSDSDVPLVNANSSKTRTVPPPRGSQNTRRQRKNTNDASPRPRKRRETSRMAIGRPRPANNVMRERTQNRVQSNLPRWPEPAKLPYDVLLSIFQYAAYPLVDATMKSTASAPWLVKIALLRRDFLEPAMAALYHSPPLEPATRAHSLLNALNSQTEASLVDYRRKIHYLEIPVREVLNFKCQGRDPLTLAQMLTVMPMLRGVRANWMNDDPALFPPGNPCQPSKVHSLYGEQIWRLLDEKTMKMTHWKWNYAFGSLQFPYPWGHLQEIHQLPCLKDLKSVEICCLLNNKMLKSMSSALGELNQLEHLTISNPGKLRPDDIALLFEHVRPLISLSFLHCIQLTSDLLVEILKNNGSAMRHLTLNHNQNLDLAFLSELATFTPHLETLTMDLTFFSKLSTVRSADPGFEYLLPEGHTPQWPRTLQRLQLVHLRKWDTEAAYRFFASLVDAAPELKDLRYLGVRMSVDADWRDRVKFRNIWEQRMVRVFQRRSPSPRRWTGGSSASAVAAQKKSARQATQREEAADAEADNSGTEEDDARRIALNTATHGMCDRVDVRIENLRPMDQLLDESNFLDEEKSGDEDYRD